MKPYNIVGWLGMGLWLAGVIVLVFKINVAGGFITMWLGVALTWVAALMQGVVILQNSRRKP